METVWGLLYCWEVDGNLGTDDPPIQYWLNQPQLLSGWYCLQQTGKPSSQQLLRPSWVSQVHILTLCPLWIIVSSIKIKLQFNPPMFFYQSTPTSIRERNLHLLTITTAAVQFVYFFCIFHCFQTTSTVNYPVCYNASPCVIWYRLCDKAYGLA